MHYESCPSVFLFVCLSVCSARASNSKTKMRRKLQLVHVNVSQSKNNRRANFSSIGQRPGLGFELNVGGRQHNMSALG